MLTDAQIADQYAWLYADTIPVPAGTWDHVIDGPLDAYVCVKTIDGVHYVMFRGSTTFLDWISDFADEALQWPDAVLGGVHAGFRDGVCLVREALDDIVGDQNPVVIVGHSLGAGHAVLYAGYRVAAGKCVSAIVMFGEPRAGGKALADILASVPIRSYRNGDATSHDLVTDVPRSVPLVLDYRHPRELIDVSNPPPPSDSWGPFAFHHYRLYCAALGATGPAVQSLSA